MHKSYHVNLKKVHAYSSSGVSKMILGAERLSVYKKEYYENYIGWIGGQSSAIQ